MAKSREQMIQEQLGAMAFQIAVLAADLEAMKEENAALKADSAKSIELIRTLESRIAATERSYHGSDLKAV